MEYTGGGNTNDESEAVNIGRNNKLQNAIVDSNTFQCNLCQRPFKTYRVLLQHLKFCSKKKQNEFDNVSSKLIVSLNEPGVNNHTANFKWNDVDGLTFNNLLNDIYGKIVYWRKNLFLLPTGAAGKKYFRELARLLQAWVDDSPLKDISMVEIHVMPAFLLQKPSKTSKSKDHTKALERRLKLWDEGKIDDLFHEGRTIKDNLKTYEFTSATGRLSKQFHDRMQKGDINGALRLLTNTMSNVILALNEDTLLLLEQKHPEGKPAVGMETIIKDPLERIHAIAFNEINEDIILKAASITKGGSGPSGMDAEGWRRILTSSQYGTATSDLRKIFADVIKKLCIEKITPTSNDSTSIDAFLACRLIPLSKNPGLRPIGVGEVLRRIAGKVVMTVAKNHVTNSTGSIQVFAGQESGSEAAIHAMHDIFKDDGMRQYF